MSFTLWPAIDLKEGKCVRLLHGKMDQATTYADDPGAQAKAFAKAGFRHLHVVDLDGAFAGKPANADAVKSILSATNATVQLGGGIRSLSIVDEWLTLGVTRIIIGTAAVKDPDFVKQALAAFPGRIVIGLDARDGKVATEGWDDISELTALEVLNRFEKSSIAAIVYTDISRDGALTGANVDMTRALARDGGVPVLASGGVASIDDLTALSHYTEDGLAGAILGRSLYEGTIDPSEALKVERT